MNERSVSQSSVQKVFAVLDLFSVERSALSADEIIGEIGCSRPQGYRYIRDLSQAGFLVRSASMYRLGARVIELDHIVRQSDPLLHAAMPVMQDIAKESGCDALLTRLVGDRIITIHHERGNDATTVSYSRGHVMPRFRGSGSKAIMAALPLSQQRAFYEAFAGDEGASALGDDWGSVRATLKEIRRRGAAISEGELDPDSIGVATAIPLDAGGAYASFVLVLSAARYKTTDLASVARLVQAAAARVAERMREAPLPRLTPAAA